MSKKDEALKDEDAPCLAKHAMEYHGLTLKQFVLMCEEAHKRYEGQFSSSVDKHLAVECFNEGFKVACKEALEQPAQDTETMAVAIALQEQIRQLKELEKINQSHKWKSLTNPEIRKCWRIADGNIIEFARAIDYLLKAKNGQTI